MSLRLPIIFLALSAVLGTGCSPKTLDENHTMRTRPVSVLELEEQDFARESHLTGSVSPERTGFSENLPAAVRHLRQRLSMQCLSAFYDGEVFYPCLACRQASALQKRYKGSGKRQ